jgi:hypothetical protein
MAGRDFHTLPIARPHLRCRSSPSPLARARFWPAGVVSAGRPSAWNVRRSKSSAWRKTPSTSVYADVAEPFVYRAARAGRGPDNLSLVPSQVRTTGDPHPLAPGESREKSAPWLPRIAGSPLPRSLSEGLEIQRPDAADSARRCSRGSGCFGLLARVGWGSTRHGSMWSEPAEPHEIGNPAWRSARRGASVLTLVIKTGAWRCVSPARSSGWALALRGRASCLSSLL